MNAIGSIFSTTKKEVSRFISHELQERSKYKFLLNSPEKGETHDEIPTNVDQL